MHSNGQVCTAAAWLAMTSAALDCLRAIKRRLLLCPLTAFQFELLSSSTSAYTHDHPRPARRPWCVYLETGLLMDSAHRTFSGRRHVCELQSIKDVSVPAGMLEIDILEAQHIPKGDYLSDSNPYME